MWLSVCNDVMGLRNLFRDSTIMDLSQSKDYSFCYSAPTFRFTGWEWVFLSLLPKSFHKTLLVGRKHEALL